MRKSFFVLVSAVVLGFAPQESFAQESFSGQARALAESSITDTRKGTEIRLAISQVVPYRIYTLADPWRLVMDFQEVTFGSLPQSFDQSEAMLNWRAGAVRPGWTRMVLEFADPILLKTAELRTDANKSEAQLIVNVLRTDEATARARSGAPASPQWSIFEDVDIAATPLSTEEGLTIAIDPGHGGIDPGAERGGFKEADVMLAFAKDLAIRINTSGRARAILTRESDEFVPLGTRMSIARSAGADALISLHADALDESYTFGSSVYTLSAEASDAASELMAERHGRGDLIGGVDLSTHEDDVALALMELARTDTSVESRHLASDIVSSLQGNGARVNSRPMRRAQLAVLNAADFPSVLIELGFMSNPDDLHTLTQNGPLREALLNGLANGILTWYDSAQARASLLQK